MWPPLARWPSPAIVRYPLSGSGPARLNSSLFRRKCVGDVVLVNVADVGDRFLAYVSGYFQLDILEPSIRVEAVLFRLLSKMCNSIRASIVAGEW